jgi:hypothetical protein
MGIIRKLFNTAIWGSVAGTAGFAFATRNSKFVPFSPTDPIFSSAAYERNNPNRNPATQDVCVRKVPLSSIKPALLEKAGEGKLVEAFCAGVWSGLGMCWLMLIKARRMIDRRDRLCLSTFVFREEVQERYHN